MPVETSTPTKICDKVHIMVYVDRSVIDRWKRTGATHTTTAARKPDHPWAYGSAQERLFTLASCGLQGAGAVVWAVSCLKFGKTLLPPAVVARLEVAHAFDLESQPEARQRVPPYFKRDWIYHVEGMRGRPSSYYPLNNGYSVLFDLEFVTKKPDARRIRRDCDHCRKQIEKTGSPYSGIPQHLQTVRELTAESGGRLESHADAVVRKRIVFLSYRRRSGSALAMQLAARLVEHDFVCWLDHWMMPRPVAKGALPLEDPVVEDSLRDGIRQSSVFVSLVTGDYRLKGRTTWAETEWLLAEDLRRTVKPELANFEVDLGGRLTGDGRAKLVGTDPDSLVQQIAKVVA